MSDKLKLCRDCRHSVQRLDRDWVLMCQHPKVWAGNGWALARPHGDETKDGVDGAEERNKTGIFGTCGQKGRLWEQQP